MAVGKSMCTSSSLSEGKGEGGKTFEPLVVAEVSAASLDVLTLQRYGSDASVWNVSRSRHPLDIVSSFSDVRCRRADKMLDQEGSWGITHVKRSILRIRDGSNPTFLPPNSRWSSSVLTDACAKSGNTDVSDGGLYIAARLGRKSTRRRPSAISENTDCLNRVQEKRRVRTLQAYTSKRSQSPSSISREKDH